MSSQFFGLTIAYSGLNAAQASINTTANNISNVNTDGYSRQVTNLTASSALRVYQKYGTAGSGVSVDSITQVRDSYYDTKYWENQSSLGYYEKKLYYMEQIEDYFTDGTLSTNSDSGFSSIFTDMFVALDDVKTNAGDSSARGQFISTAEELTSYFNSMATQLENLQSSVNDEVKTTVDNINSITQRIASLNKQINILEMQGGYANELRDERANLVDELSSIIPVTVEESEVINSNNEDQYTGATYYTVKVNGQLLVDNYEYNELACVTRTEKYNQCDIEGLYDIVWADTGATFDATATNMSGELKALFEIRDGNNAENLTGTITATTSTTLTISNPSITDIDEMNMPDEGTIWANNKQYYYDSFTCETDEDGNITSYTFHLKTGMSTSEQSKLYGEYMEVGDTVDYMGIPYYMNQMSTFLRSFTEAFNAIEQSGVDANGDAMGSFFVAENVVTGGEYDMTDGISSTTFSSSSNTYYQLTASNVTIASATLKDSDIFATTADATAGVDAYDLVEELMTLQSDVELFRGGAADTFLQCIYSDVTVDTQECQLFTDNYTSIGETIENQRLSVSGVDEDEEALDLIKFQNAYNLASKCISVLTEMYDQLILSTGV